MSDQDSGGGSAGVFIGAAIGGCAVIVVVIAVVIYCYLKARKEKFHSNMANTTDVFTTAASNTQANYPVRSRVNQYPDPEAARKAGKSARRYEQHGHSNPAYERHGSESASSDQDDRDISPPRMRRPRGGEWNEAFTSDSSCEESMSCDDEDVHGLFFTVNEIRNDMTKSSYKKSRHDDLIDSAKTNDRNKSNRRSRRDLFNKSDSPLTIDVLEKHEQRTRQETYDRGIGKSKDTTQTRSHDGSTATGTDFTATTDASGHRFAKNPHLRRSSPSRSSSHTRYRKDNEKDSTGRRKPRRTRSSGRTDRSKSAGDGERRSRSGSTGSRDGNSSVSHRSRKSKVTAIEKVSKAQALLPIFSDTPLSSTV